MALPVLRFFGCLLGSALLLPTAAWAGNGQGHIDHVESRNGQLDLLFSVTGVPAGVVPDLRTVRVSVDGKRVHAKAHTTADDSGTIRRTAVLAIDVSKSMAGAPFRQAKDAAQTFLDQTPSDVRVGIVTFARRVVVVHSPTTDRGALRDSVQALELSGGTSLYDGVLEATAAAGSRGSRDILVLSDGSDRTRTPLRDVIHAVDGSGISVDVVALAQRGHARTALEAIADAGRGTVIDASDPQALQQAFVDEAAALAAQVLISFPVSQSMAGADASIAVEVQADGSAYSDTAVVGLKATTAPQPLRSPAVAQSGPVIGRLFLVLGVSVLGLGMLLLLLVSVGAFSGRGSNRIDQRLAAYGKSGHGASATPVSVRDVSVKRAAVGVAEKALGDGKLAVGLARKLDASGVPLTAAEWLLLRIGTAVTALIVGVALGRGRLLPLVLFLALGLGLPWVYLTFKRARRLKRFAAQLAPTLQVMSGSLSAGLSLAQSVETVAHEAADPVSTEFRRAILEQRLGVEIETALEGVGERMDSKDFAWMVMAIRIQRDVGGNLSELLNTVAATLREREYLRRQVSTLSAEGRLSAWIIGGLPPMFVLYLALVRPEYLSPMLHTPLGILLLIVAAIMMAIGAFWLRKTVQIEV